MSKRAKFKFRSCLICFREFPVWKAGKNYYRGRCPYCGTIDKGTGNGRLETNAEYLIYRELEEQDE